MICPACEVENAAGLSVCARCGSELSKRHDLKGKTDFDDLPPRSPPYWGKYIFHDNNRDAIQATSAVTEAALDIFFRFHPAVALDLHESIPLLYVSTGTGPYNEAVDPVTIFQWQQMANYEVGRVTAAGMPGAWTWGFYDGWSPNYLIWIANTHNATGRFYETFGNATAETVERELDPERTRFAGTQWKPTGSDSRPRSIAPRYVLGKAGARAGAPRGGLCQVVTMANWRVD